MKNLYFLILYLVAATSSAQVDIQLNGSLEYATILSNGTTTAKFDIVFVGDGFTAAQQTLFNQKVDEAVVAMENRTPYTQTMCAFNIWRVNVLSDESGVDHPADGVFRNSELDCRYGDPDDDEAERCITSDSPLKCYEAANHAPAWDVVFVLVNDTQWGGCAGDIVFSSIASGFAQIITHELGHYIGELADEYTCYICDGSDDNEAYVGGEHPKANLTNNTNRATTKWADLINATTPIPTTSNVPPGVVGLWEGGGYKAQDIYRPQFICQMKSSSEPFCAVCLREMRANLESHCTYCELNPHDLLCVLGDLPYEIHWWDRLRIRWPWPICLSCPPDNFKNRFDIVLEGITFPESQLIIYDEQGEVVTRSSVQQAGQPLRASFEGNWLKNYSVELITSAPQADKLKIGAAYKVR